ncbi:hypothetical protein AAFF_G00285350 [Aldrovandia affinis]|uniref:Uncharacterized protein n=1 Tax=Aldrovandia affinis TaxID=143900 RepID=A0AAD7TAS0_9TELE|nr:hypothetical protein AAFF_G00285350 [Aldrovandia affinis]
MHGPAPLTSPRSLLNPWRKTRQDGGPAGPCHLAADCMQGHLQSQTLGHLQDVGRTDSTPSRIVQSLQVSLYPMFGGSLIMYGQATEELMEPLRRAGTPGLAVGRMQDRSFEEGGGCSLIASQRLVYIMRKRPRSNTATARNGLLRGQEHAQYASKYEAPGRPGACPAEAERGDAPFTGGAGCSLKRSFRNETISCFNSPRPQTEAETERLSITLRRDQGGG